MSSLYLQHNVQKKTDKINELFKHTLNDDKEQGSKEAREYLRNRGISDDLIKKFQIGWYPPNRYCSDRDKLLSGRIIFPIADEYGDIRAFSGRSLNWKKGDKFPKYYHESYPKGFFLYGLDIAWRHILQKNRVILVEGQTDVIRCHGAGLSNTVGIMGSSLKFEGFVKLSRFCDRFILMFDCDEAGEKCREKTEKLLDSYKKEYISVRLETKSGNFDPDGFAKKYGNKGLLKAVLYYMNKKQDKE